MTTPMVIRLRNRKQNGAYQGWRSGEIENYFLYLLSFSFVRGEGFWRQIMVMVAQQHGVLNATELDIKMMKMVNFMFYILDHNKNNF